MIKKKDTPQIITYNLLLYDLFIVIKILQGNDQGLYLQLSNECERC